MENGAISKFRCLSRDTLKYIVIVLMFLDHIADKVFTTQACTVIQFVARLTAITMCYFIACGYQYTRNLNKYMLRMFVFGVISIIPFVYFVSEGTSFLPIILRDGNCGKTAGVAAFKYIPSIDKTLTVYSMGVILVFFLALLTIRILDSEKINILLKVLLMIPIFWLSLFCDWRQWAIMYCVVLYFFRNKPVLKWIMFLLTSFVYIYDIISFDNVFDLSTIHPVSFHSYRCGVFIALPVFWFFYNNEKSAGNNKSEFRAKFDKWFFYIFYPVHLIIISIWMKAIGVF